MRIIAGMYKGRRLATPRDDSIRPTTDFIREALFGILSDRLAGSRVLDLFGGTGAVALESLSRGASMAVSCDSAREAVALIRRNAQSMGAPLEVYQADYAVATKRLAGRTFDLVYLDPPYAMDIMPVLAAIVAADLVATGGLVVYEHDKQTAFLPPAGWRITDERKYGRVALSFLAREIL